MKIDSPLALVVVADLSATPKTLTVMDKNRGCKWMAVQP